MIPITYKSCPRCQTPARLSALSCSKCGRHYQTKFPAAPQPTQRTRVFSYPPRKADLVPCFRCHVPIASTAKYCPQCCWDQRKHSLEQEPVNTTPTTPFSTEQRQERQGSTSQLFAQSKKTEPIIISLVLGVLGLVAWYIPFLGFPITITGMTLSLIALRSERLTTDRRALAGLVLSLIGLILTTGNSAIGKYQTVHGEPARTILQRQAQQD